jgi:hypothetical protein
MRSEVIADKQMRKPLTPYVAISRHFYLCVFETLCVVGVRFIFDSDFLAHGHFS